MDVQEGRLANPPGIPSVCRRVGIPSVCRRVGIHTISVQEGRLANPSAIPSVYTIRLCGLISDHIRGNSSSTYLLNLILLHQ